MPQSSFFRMTYFDSFDNNKYFNFKEPNPCHQVVWQKFYVHQFSYLCFKCIHARMVPTTSSSHVDMTFTREWLNFLQGLEKNYLENFEKPYLHQNVELIIIFKHNLTLNTMAFQNMLLIFWNFLYWFIAYTDFIHQLKFVISMSVYEIFSKVRKSF